MKTPEQKRRYYLHRKLKGLVSIQARSRTISHVEGFTPPSTILDHYNELLTVYKYKIQYAIL